MPCNPRTAFRLVGAAAMVWICAAPALPAQSTHRFVNRNRSFSLDIPADWRQMAPDEARRLRDQLPVELHRTEPQLFYAIGPVDRWLAGGFDGAHIYVVEQGEEWVLGDDIAGAMQQEWQRLGRESGLRHEVTEVRRTTVGPAAHPVIECLRDTAPEGGGATLRSLDIYAATGGRQVLLAFRSRRDDFARWLPGYRKMLDTLTFASPPRGEATLADRLWTPILVGGLVGLVLVVLYRHTRRRV